MPYHFDWAPIWANRDLIVDGFLMTIALSALALCLALVIGVIVGTDGASQRPAVAAVLLRGCSADALFRRLCGRNGPCRPRRGRARPALGGARNRPDAPAGALLRG